MVVLNRALSLNSTRLVEFNESARFKTTITIIIVLLGFEE